jgi:RNA polymerase sigma-70 factor (ECF subfamily)
MDMDLEQEKELVERAKYDTVAFGELYDQYYSRIYGYSLRRTASVQIAEDVTSEVFLKVLKNLRKFCWRDVPFSSWLYRIASNEIANYFKKNGNGQISLENVFDSLDDIELVNADNELKKYDEYIVLHENISKLSIKYQEVIVLRFFEDKQVKEIGEILGKSEGTVKSLLHRGLEKLAKLAG